MSEDLKGWKEMPCELMDDEQPACSSCADTEDVKVPRSGDVDTEGIAVSMPKRASHLLGEFVKTDRWTHPAVLIL